MQSIREKLEPGVVLKVPNALGKGALMKSFDLTTTTHAVQKRELKVRLVTGTS